jgi:hypothetical protein
MVGLGWSELLIVVVVGGFLLGTSVIVIALLMRSCSSSGSDRLAQLEEENMQLRKLLAENGIPTSGVAPPKK